MESTNRWYFRLNLDFSRYLFYSILMKPKVAIIFTDGLNRETETKYAFEHVGGDAEVIHINSLISGEKNLKDYQILACPGGFSYGDDVVSAKILANTLLYKVREQIESFMNDDKLIIGICNGFQALVRMGLLPFRNIGSMDASLIHNDKGKFESRFVRLRVEETNCVFTKGLEGKIIEVPISHAEGKFVASEEVVKKLEDDKQVVFRYVNSLGHATDQYPANPNGALRAIAGITDPTGKIMGLMPHPECNIKRNQHPNWNTTSEDTVPGARYLFENAVRYFV